MESALDISAIAAYEEAYPEERFGKYLRILEKWIYYSAGNCGAPSIAPDWPRQNLTWLNPQHHSRAGRPDLFSAGDSGPAALVLNERPPRPQSLRGHNANRNPNDLNSFARWRAIRDTASHPGADSLSACRPLDARWTGSRRAATQREAMGAGLAMATLPAGIRPGDLVPRAHRLDRPSCPQGDGGRPRAQAADRAVAVRDRRRGAGGRDHEACDLTSRDQAALPTHRSLVTRGNVAVVRRGAQPPSSQSGAVPLELSRPECGTVVGIIVPPDVRFAGRSCRMRAHLGS